MGPEETHFLGTLVIGFISAGVAGWLAYSLGVKKSKGVSLRFCELPTKTSLKLERREGSIAVISIADVGERWVQDVPLDLKPSDRFSLLATKQELECHTRLCGVSQAVSVDIDRPIVNGERSAVSPTESSTGAAESPVVTEN